MALFQQCLRIPAKLSPQFSHAVRFSASSRALCGELIRKKTVDLIGCPFQGGQPKGGVDLAPDILRPGITKQVKSLGWQLNDLGNVITPKPKDEKTEISTFDRVKNPLWVGEVTRDLSNKVADSSGKAHFPLVVGGDHSIAVGTVSGMARTYPNLGVLWIDAHADINTSGTTPSGNLHGMPLSFLMGLTRPVPGFEWLDMQNPPLKLDQLVYVGLRDLQNQEKDFLRDHNIKSFDMHDVDKYGIGAVMETAMTIFGDRPLHLSFDIDALDPRETPSTGTPVRGGLTFREAAYICEFAHRTNKLVSMELVEINPNLGSEDDVNLTLDTGLSLIKAALGDALTHSR